MNQADSFVKDGYFVHAFEKLDALQRVKNDCEAICQDRLGGKFTSLEDYHLIDISADEHDQLQFDIYSYLNKQKHHHQFVEDNLAFFTALLGPDLDIQTNHYLRITRPGYEIDNIGIHRDTDYGNTAYEVSLSMPLIDQETGAGLNVIPGSHFKEHHVVEQVNRKDVVKGTNKNEMGFLYAPKIPVGLNEKDLECIDLRFGQALGFTLGLMHGQVVNKSQKTRWSIDFRLKNSFHPICKNLKQNYYSSFKSGPVSLVGNQYYDINIEEVDALRSEGLPTSNQ